MEHPGGVVGFNLTFDAFHLAQMATTLLLMSDKTANLEDCINEYAMKEPEGRDGPCFKPVRALDLMLHARKGPYQSTMNRGDIRIRRVPSPLSYLLAAELDRRIPLPDIYFSRQKVKKKWQSYAILDVDGDVNPDFRDVVLKFAPSSGLKALAVDALKVPEDEIMAFGDIEPPDIYGEDGKAVALEECGYAPYALAVEDVRRVEEVLAGLHPDPHRPLAHAREGQALRREGHRLHPRPARPLQQARAGGRRQRAGLHGRRREVEGVQDRPRGHQGPESQGNREGQHRSHGRQPRQAVDLRAAVAGRADRRQGEHEEDHPRSPDETSGHQVYRMQRDGRN